MIVIDQCLCPFVLIKGLTFHFLLVWLVIDMVTFWEWKLASISYIIIKGECLRDACKNSMKVQFCGQVQTFRHLVWYFLLVFKKERPSKGGLHYKLLGGGLSTKNVDLQLGAWKNTHLPWILLVDKTGRQGSWVNFKRHFPDYYPPMAKIFPLVSNLQLHP